MFSSFLSVKNTVYRSVHKICCVLIMVTICICIPGKEKCLRFPSVLVSPFEKSYYYCLVIELLPLECPSHTWSIQRLHVMNARLPLLKGPFQSLHITQHFVFFLLRHPAPLKLWPTQRFPRPIMSEQGNYSNLESDGCPDFSKFDNRFQSFRGSTLAGQVPPERLARAGFYFTGNADRVQCFSCNQTVENWHSGDTPVQRHKEVNIFIGYSKNNLFCCFFCLIFDIVAICFLLVQVSPSCQFLVCCHPNSMKPNYITPLIYDEVAEDMQYRVSTGEVVDETLYPRIPHMKSEQARLDSFSSWPSNVLVRPRDLAQAGFYYLGQADRVECFCCGNKLNNWENGDRPWEEHTKHFPNCFFILGHDVGNAPLLDNADEPMWEDRNVNRGGNMETFEGRLSSFAHVRHPVDHERLARAGFYSTGRAQIWNINRESVLMLLWLWHRNVGIVFF